MGGPKWIIFNNIKTVAKNMGLKIGNIGINGTTSRLLVIKEIVYAYDQSLATNYTYNSMRGSVMKR